MNTKTKDVLKELVERQVLQLAREMQSGKPLTDGQHQAIAMHALSVQVGEAAAALGRIYMALETRKDKP